MSNLGNIAWILDSENTAIGDRDPTDYLPEYIEASRNHFVPPDQAFWTKEGYEAFCAFRMQEMFLVGKKLFTRVFSDEEPAPVETPR